MNSNESVIIKSKHFHKWTKFLYSTEFTWREAIEFCMIHTWPFSSGWETESKTKWDSLISVRIRKGEPKMPAYMAITFAFLSLPYHRLRKTGPRCTYVPEILAQQINVGLLYERGECFVTFKDYGGITAADGPYFPPQYSDWLGNQYNKASWYITFLLYESRYIRRLVRKGALWSGC